MKKLKALFLFLSAVFIMAACSGGDKVSDYEKIHSRLSAMTAYRAVCRVTYCKSKTENTYVINQTAESGGKYKIEAVEPKDLEGTSILFDGNLIWLYNSSIDSKLQVASGENDRKKEIILFTFLKNETTSGAEAAVSASSSKGEKYVVLEASIPGGDSNYSKEALYVDIKTGNPSRLVIYDGDGEEYITEEFTEFEYNPEISESEFKIASEIIKGQDGK
ncbi:MAG: outer-membrane lipoprotein carrier protein LolA [Clostridiales bacterium]|nr:outer-membrane lipoprotein carrier protein LolA [Clostridiales bacterium]